MGSAALLDSSDARTFPSWQEVRMGSVGLDHAVAGVTVPVVTVPVMETFERSCRQV